MWNRVVSGVFDNHADAGDAIKELQKAQVKSKIHFKNQESQPYWSNTRRLKLPVLPTL